MAGVTAYWLAHWTPDRADWVRAEEVIAFCSWTRFLTLKELLSEKVYEWVPANLMPRR